MRRFLCCLALAVGLSGCSYNRADFVSNADGKADTANMSDAGKTTGSLLRNGPHLGVSY
jgi:hypothetical protein